VINALLKNDALGGSMRLDWEMVREVVASEDGMPIEIAIPQEAVANHEATPLEL
jgi:L,D-transpeptidase ErfK/SrfK